MKQPETDHGKTQGTKTQEIKTQETQTQEIIAFQGAPGAYSEMAILSLFPNAETRPCHTFADAFDTLRDDKDVTRAFIPVDNSIAGRVADVHHLLPQYNLHIVGETFLPIHHCLLVAPQSGATIKTIKTVHSHLHALPQCRQFIRDHGWREVVEPDTAGAAKLVAEMADPGRAAIASKLAGERYDLEVLAEEIQDHDHNTTRFLILANQDNVPPYQEETTDKIITSLIFTVRHTPAALYKALGGFATTGLNLLKLESYMAPDDFRSARFYCEIAGHRDDPMFETALEELGFYAREIKWLGTYPAAKTRPQ